MLIILLGMWYFLYDSLRLSTPRAILLAVYSVYIYNIYIYICTAFHVPPALHTVHTEITGTPFSEGLFRAFFMLDSTTLPTANFQGLGSAGTVTTTPVAGPSSPTGNPQEGPAAATRLSPSSDDIGDSSGVPRVSLPQLRAILEHGGGMTTADVSDVCEIVARKEEEEEESRSRNRTQRTSLQPSATTAVVGATSETLVANAGSAGGDIEEDQDIQNSNTTTDDRDGGGQHDLAAAKCQSQREEPPLTVSFATVSECETVRAWLRKGAYSLAAFDVTSGQR